MLGKPRAFVHFFVFVAILGLILAIGSRTLNSAIAFIGLGFFLVGSIVAVRRIWKERGNQPANTFPSQISVLPKKWQKWVLGEDDDGKG
ncbi:hypothetical protein [Steroidobacter cummioxidans]|uniref:hypothetical protein n=1 Tax=Steroidobacter cummioxidans TaxID=1803913 RepID=UPI000E30E8C7|nr:hypothetical protein [Steroidobacter cummioxidans]